MAPIPSGGVVAVTGAAGFIGSHIVVQLLQRGYCVRACVRDAEAPKADFLKAMPQHCTGRLTLHSCDINVPGVFDPVLDGASGVVHTADQLMSAGGEEKGHTASAHPTAAVQAVAAKADAQKTGARGLRSIVEVALNNAMYELPTWREQGVTHILVTEETINEGKMPRLFPDPAACEASTGYGVASCGTCDDKADEEPAAAIG